MEKKFSVLIYEKEINLNSILKEQFLQLEDYETTLINDQIKLFEVINKEKFDVCILNSNYLKNDLLKFLEIYQGNSNNKNIIIYYDKDEKLLIERTNQLFLLQKPFKLINLIEYVNNLKKIKYNDRSIKYLTKNIEFVPIKKIISNLITQHKEHLTEKETNLLNYLYKRKNVKLSKVDLLANIWGVKEDINTHTLETHIYRLKQKLHKLDPDLSFSLVNQNGLYCLKDNV